VQERLEALREQLHDLPDGRRASMERMVEHALADVETLSESEDVLRRRDEERYRTLFDSSNDAIFIHDLEGRILEVNRVACERLGYTREELLSMTPDDLDAPEYVPLVAERLERLRRRGSLIFETAHVCRDGTVIPVELSSRIVQDNGQTVALSSARDISARKRAEALLEENRQRLQGLFDNALESILLADDDTHYVDANPAACELTGYTRAELLELQMSDLTPAVESEQARARWQAFVANGTQSGEHVILRKDGSHVPVEYRAVANILPGLHLSVMRDVTEWKQTRQRLQQYAQELERSNRELQQFASIASHDLQEPLRVMIGYAQLLSRRYGEQLDEDGREFLDYLAGGANRMHALVQGLLEYSRVGAKGVHPARVDGEVLLEQVLTNLRRSIEESGAIVTHDPLPVVVADELQLARVFQNLIANSIKFRSEEQPRIHVSAERRGDEWTFSVRDNGIGIDPQHAERIFLIFQRLHTREEYPGSGIGLAICKKIVMGHGGRIWVESQPGRGAVFSFTLPAQGEEDGETKRE
jgi:PAS domain S-box-containing protein